jgi:hypothetical protein
VKNKGHGAESREGKLLFICPSTLDPRHSVPPPHPNLDPHGGSRRSGQNSTNRITNSLEKRKEPKQWHKENQPNSPTFLSSGGDDIGWFNISAYSHGLMGYKRPNIDVSAGIATGDLEGRIE